MKLSADLVRDFRKASSLEWLLADGRGGYASSTPIGVNTRRYHGLLVVARKPPVDRMVLLSKVEEILVIGDRRYELSSNAYPGTIHPRGFEWARSFSLEPLPSLSFDVDGARLTRTIARAHGESGVAIVYSYAGERRGTLELRPLVAYRGLHALQHENSQVDPNVRRDGWDVVLRPYPDAPPLVMRVPGAEWRTDACWFRNFEYEQEKRRGFDFREDLFSHGFFSKPLNPGETVGFLAYASTIPPAREALSLLQNEKKRIFALGLGGAGRLAELRRAADAFVVARGSGSRTVVAGYHWFADWGRDTMIALPGLCLSTGRHDDARAILLEFAEHVEGGLIPNRFPDDGSPPEYNTVDAALWMVLAVGRYLEASGQTSFVVERLRPAVEAILEGYRRGTRHGIRLDSDGLITQGAPGLQLTWMDAKVGDHVVTPRAGKPVEIQALFYNALLVGAEIATAAGDASRATLWKRVAASLKKAFLEAFWIDEKGYLADVVDGQSRDVSLRPNQVHAIGLPHALLPRDRAQSVLEKVEESLLTPVGLRTLAPWDPAYKGRYQGGSEERDSAYHQGTVWPYLMGVYFDALIRLHGEAGKSRARQWLQEFAEREVEGLGFVGEVYDGDPPHAPGGAIAQAWSVAELLRIETRLAGRSALPPIEETR